MTGPTPRRDAPTPVSTTPLPDNCLVVMRVPSAAGCLDAARDLSHLVRPHRRRGVTGVVLLPGRSLEALSDADLAGLGLQRIPPADPPRYGPDALAAAGMVATLLSDEQAAGPDLGPPADEPAAVTMNYTPPADPRADLTCEARVVAGGFVDVSPPGVTMDDTPPEDTAIAAFNPTARAIALAALDAPRPDATFTTVSAPGVVFTLPTDEQTARLDLDAPADEPAAVVEVNQ